MICRVINEGSTPRYALEGSQTHVESGRPQWSRRSVSQWARGPWPAANSGRRRSQERAEANELRRGCSRRRRPVLPAHSRQTLLVALPIALFFHRALVVLLLTLGNTDLQFGATVLPVQLQRHQGVTLAIGGNPEVLDLFRVQQQFARTDRVGYYV